MKNRKNDIMNDKSHLWGNVVKLKKEEKENIFQVLKKIHLFSDLSHSEFKEIVRIIHHRRFQADEVVFWEGEPGMGMYIIQSGQVGIFRQFKTENQKELALLNPFDFFGEMALLNEEFRSASAVSLMPSSLIALFHPDLADLIERKPRLGIKILLKLADILASRLRKTDQDLQELCSHCEKSEPVK